MSAVTKLIRSILRFGGALVLLAIVISASIVIGAMFGGWAGLAAGLLGTLWTYKKLKREMRADDQPAEVDTAPNVSNLSRPRSSTAKSDDSTDNKSGFRVQITLSDGEDYVGDYRFSLGPHCDATFVDATSNVSVRGNPLRGPLYVGNLSKVSAARDPSVIDPNLKVGSKPSDEPLGYWPSYKAATPGQRARYLEWLAGPREEIDELGYVFLYFYGMERYVLLTAQHDTPEQRSARLRFTLKELARLQRLFSHSRSFLSYSARLREALIIRYAPELIDRLKGIFPESNTVALPFQLARMANSGDRTPLDSDWVLQWLIHAGELRRLKVVRANYQLLRKLFRGLYEKTDGVAVPKNKTLLTMHYNAASSGLQDVDFFSVHSDWCDPSVLRRPLKPVLPLLETATSALRRLCRAVDKESSLDFFAAWPREIPFGPPPRYEKTYQIVRAQCRREPITTLRSLGIAFRSKLAEKPTKRQVRLLRDALATCGWVLVPDPDLTPCTLRSHDRVRVYKGSPPDGLSDAGRLLEINLRLAAVVALADGEVHDDEAAYISSLVDSHPDALEREYFRHCSRWHLAEERSAIGLKAQIEALDRTERQQLSDRLVEMAEADGYLPRQEILALEKYFDRLGLPKSHVVQKLHSKSAVEKISRPSWDQFSKSADDKTSASRPVGVSLDRAAIQAHRQSTRKIQSVLSEIFEPPPEITEVPEQETLVSDAWHNGDLDATHHALATHLMTQESWSREAVEHYCQMQDLMFEGAIETINEVAFEHLGDPLIEVDDRVYVDKELIFAS